MQTPVFVMRSIMTDHHAQFYQERIIVEPSELSKEVLAAHRQVLYNLHRDDGIRGDFTSDRNTIL